MKSMIAKIGSEISFIDSNIWLYALMGRQSPDKYKIALPFTKLLNMVVSVQVINEVCANLLKKAQFTEEQIQKVVTSFYLDCEVINFNEIIFLEALNLRLRYKLSY